MARELHDLFSVEEEKINLALGALTVARTEYPNLDPSTYLRKLEEMGEQAKTNITEEEAPERIRKLNRLLFDELGFHGASDSYYDPRNSFLNDVLDRRTGIPITLSIVYMEVAKRIGLKIDGVGFPGHFIVRYAVKPYDIIIDPFNKGRFLTTDDLRQMLRNYFRGSVELQDEFLRPWGKREMMTRLLSNLQNVYLSEGNHGKLFPIVEMIYALNWESPTAAIDFANLYVSVGKLSHGVSALEEYLRNAPNPEAAEEVRSRLSHIRRLMARFG